MLKLTRHVGQSIHIGENIKVIFLEQRKGNVRLGIEAPKDVLILRSEIRNKNFKQKGNVYENTTENHPIV
jgi:carbon storage regulator